MDVRKKILFIVPSMRGGGSERVISIIVNHLNRDKFDITLALLKKEGKYLNELPNDIQIIDLNARQARYSILKIIKLIYQLKPNVVFSTLGYLNLIVSIIRPIFSKKIKFIARESNIVSIQNKQEKYPKFFNFLYKIFYKNFDTIICQSNCMKKDLINNFGIDNNKLVVINNPVNIDRISELSNTEEILFDNNRINIIAVGRLSYQKGYDLLLNALSLLEDKYHLHIIGDGSEKESLIKLSKKLNIQNRVHFLGFQDNPYKYMAQADLMVLSSRYEGLPNVVLEANACGLPVVAFDCPGGTGEIIINGVNGFLVKCGDVEKLVDKIIEASKYEWDKEKIVNLVEKRFSLKNIIIKYENIL